MIPHEALSRSWKVVGSDIFYVAGETYSLIVDYHSKFPFIRKIHNTCPSQEVIYALKSIFGEHGIPECIISDNGPNMTATLSDNFQEAGDSITSLFHQGMLNQMDL